MMKKTLPVLLALLTLALCAFAAGCGDKKEAAAEYRRTVTNCENYDQIVLFRVLNRSKFFVNRDEQYRTEGKGSMKMTAYEKLLTTYVEAINPFSDTSDFTSAAAVRFDVYNAAETEVKLFFTVTTNSATVAVASETLAPGTWTNVNLTLNRSLIRNVGEKVMKYNFSFRNEDFLPEITGTYDLYLDNFFVELTDAEVEEPTKAFTAGEVMNFDAVTDLAFLTTSGFAQFNRTAAVLSVNADPNFAKNGNSLKMSVLRLSDASTNEIWAPTYYEYFGIMLGADYLKNVDFSGSGKTLSVDIYNANFARKRLHLRIYDEDGQEAAASAWIPAGSWGRLEISDFGRVNLSKVKYIRVMYEGYRIFNDFDLYLDNLRYE